jgi:predicted ArsR family transcriptional regulator
MTVTPARVLHTLREHPDLTANALAQRLGYHSIQMVWRRLRALERAGRVRWRLECWQERTTEVGRPRRRYRVVS